MNHLAKVKQMMRANCNNHLTAVHPKEGCQKNHSQVAVISTFFSLLLERALHIKQLKHQTNEFTK